MGKSRLRRSAPRSGSPRCVVCGAHKALVPGRVVGPASVLACPQCVGLVGLAVNGAGALTAAAWRWKGGELLAKVKGLGFVRRLLER